MKYEKKEKALEKYKEQLGEENKDLLQGLDKKNPLPESYIVKVNNADITKDVVESMKDKQGIDHVVANKELIDRIDAFTKGIRWIGIAAFVILVPISLLLIGNTIKLAVYSRKKEIGIMKYVGATDGFIRWPFIIEGVIIGLAGSIISNYCKQNIEKRQKYKVVFYAKADGVINLDVSFVGSEKGEKLASNNIR